MRVTLKNINLSSTSRCQTCIILEDINFALLIKVICIYAGRYKSGTIHVPS